MSGGPRDQDVVALATDASLAIAASADLGEMLPAVARRVAEALGVWECDVYEYRPELDALVAVATWAEHMTDEDRAWIGTVRPLDEWRSYRTLLDQRGVHEFHVGDPTLRDEDAEIMRRWGEHSVLSVPLLFQDRAVGALTLVEKRGPRQFSPGDLRLLELMAVPAAVAVHTGALLRVQAEQTRQLQALLSASKAMTSAIRLHDLLATIACAAREALDTSECAINTYDAEADALVIAALAARDPETDPAEWVGTRVSLAEYPPDREILFGARIVEERLSDAGLHDSNRRWMEEHGERTYLNVPLVFEGRPIGLLVFVELERDRHFTEQEHRLAAALGEQAAGAIAGAQLLEQTERQNRQLGLLLESLRAISSSVELEDVLAVVARTTGDALRSAQCQIQEYDAAANTVTPVAFWQRDGRRPAPDTLHRVFSLDDEPEERVFLDAKQVAQQVLSDPGLAAATRQTMEEYGDKSYLNVPLVFNEQPIGLMVLVETEQERHWTDEEVALARALSDQAAVAIEHARLYDRVQAQAVTDGLTGLHNHRHFYERLDEELARARRYGTPVSLLMIDFDDFKAFNDRHGHVAGDGVLRAMADVLRDELRRNVDIAARYGGEEFAVILPNTPMLVTQETQMELDLAGRLVKARGGAEPPPPGHRDGAENVAERIRRRVAETEFPTTPGAPPARLTVSVGAAVSLKAGGSPKELVARADEALYRAKSAGKDRVESHE